MAEIPYRRQRFSPVIIQHAVWLYLRFTRRTGCDRARLSPAPSNFSTPSWLPRQILHLDPSEDETCLTQHLRVVGSPQAQPV